MAEGLTKVCRSAVRDPGVAGALPALVVPRYAGKVAVDHVDLRVEPGELLALLGPNDAGKPTTFKVLCGMLTPTSGRMAWGAPLAGLALYLAARAVWHATLRRYAAVGRVAWHYSGM